MWEFISNCFLFLQSLDQEGLKKKILLRKQLKYEQIHFC